MGKALAYGVSPKKVPGFEHHNKKKPVKYPNTIHGHVLGTVKSAIYLGVHIQSQLNWNTHVTKIANKANATLSFLQRNLRKSPNTTKELAYKSMVRPILEYSSTVWDPHTQENASKLERVQRRAARFVKNEYNQTASVTHLLQQLNWPTLQERRAQAKVVMFYKIVNNLVAIPAPMVRQPIVIRGYSHRYLVPFARTIVYQHSFYPDAIRLWNSIPPSTVLCDNADSFSQQVQQIRLSLILADFSLHCKYKHKLHQVFRFCVMHRPACSARYS